MANLKNRVTIEYHDQLALVRLNRPDKMNGLDLDMMQALVQAAGAIRRQHDIRAVILQGEGEAFCAGLDFASVLKKPASVLSGFLPWWRKGNLFQRMCLDWRDLPMPVIAVIHGYCFGGGLQLALGCDFRISEPGCQFSIMEIKWGLVPDMGATVVLRDLLPLDTAMELTMTGRKFDAAEALELNLISRIDPQPAEAALTLARELAGHSPHAIAAIKKLLKNTRHGSERGALRRERLAQLKLLLGSNQREAMRARLEKREPVFRPR
ncbi:MAG: crotonase/enoyl-CoA hydratase family protein [Wenzhouxiangella sp.]|nr:MAG: crotonase/enoyl-CoA hydratase family protein [Wenzhouxiangella sp.]